MAVLAGQMIGPYEITAQIGAGGMGEVYRARDPRLGRDVAIKVLPASFSADPDRLQRFAQEARAAAALNHPNILAIYDIGESKGAPYVVSELLEGETLRERLRAGALGTRRATDYALQIARGLAAAHDKGIVHRDLKPENLFITADGRVKILDFGLAKLTRPEGTPSSAEAPTLQVATDPGLVMGTVGYMSPEQVRGKPADQRSDLFAFGAILYEMLSGKRAFHGETPADTMSAILKEDPPELSETARNVPPALERIVRHCLEKNPVARFQSASDVAFNLEALTEISATSRSGLRSIAGPSRSRWLIPAIAGLVVAASYVAVYFAAIRNRNISAPSFHRLTFRRGTIWAARFAPDGQTIVYGAAWDGKPDELFTTRFDSTDSRPLGLDHTELLSISSNGELAVARDVSPVAAFVNSGTLARVPLAGGAPREITENVSSADWTGDGQTLVIVRNNSFGRSQLEYPPGRVIYTPNAWVSHARVSPKGGEIAFADHVLAGDDGRIIIIDREGNRKAASSFYNTIQGLSWAANGKEVWFTAAPAGAARALYAMNLAGKERLVLRVPGTMTLQDISRDGRVLLCEDNAQMGLSALPPGETRERNLSWFDWTLIGDLSPDGRTMVFSETGEAVGSHAGVFSRKTDGSAAVRLGDGPFAALSPDGKWVAAITNTSPAQIQLLPTGAGEPKMLTHDQLDHNRMAWLPDGTGIVFIGREPNHAPRIYVLNLADGKSTPVTPEGVSGPRISTDGKYVLAIRNRQRLLYPLQGGEPRLISGLEEGDFVVQWTGNDMLVAKRGIPAKIVRLDLISGRQQDFKDIAPPDPAGIQILPLIRFSVDRKSYAYSYYRVLSDLYVVEGLK